MIGWISWIKNLPRLLADANLLRRNSELEAELSRVKEAADVASQMHYRPPYWYKGDDPNPMCARCWQDKQKPVFMEPQEEWNGGKRRDCPVCGWHFYDEPMKPALAAVNIRQHRRWKIFPDDDGRY